MGDSEMRNAGSKSGKNFQDIYRANHNKKDEQNAFQNNEARLFGDINDTVSPELATDRVRWKQGLSKLKFE